MSKLAGRPLKFAENVLRGLNQTEAYKQAGYKPKSDAAAGTCAARLLRTVRVAKYIAERQAKINERIVEKTNVTKERIVEEFAKVAFANAQDFTRLTSDGEPFIDLSKLSSEQFAAIQEVTVEDYTEGRGKDARDVKRVKVRSYNKLDALTKLGEQLGIFPPKKVSIETPDGQPFPVCMVPTQNTK